MGTNPLAGLDHLAREVEAAGIREIAGDVIVDDRLFATAVATGSGPSRISPIVINDNVIDVLARPAGKAGEPAVVTIQPATQFVTIDAVVETVEEGKPAALTVERVGPQRYAVRGQLPVGHAQVVKIGEIEQPASFARALLIEALRRHGVRVAASPLGVERHFRAAGARRGDQAPEGRRIHFAAVQRVRACDPEGEPQSSREHAAAFDRRAPRRAHAGRRPEAGGGNSQEPGTGAGNDFVRGRSRRGTVRSGHAAGDGHLVACDGGAPEFAAFDAALPVLGRDGTLAKSVAADSPARGHAHAKTGTYFVENELDGTTVLTSKALAGYLETASGRSLVFAAFVNNVPLDAPQAQSVGFRRHSRGRPIAGQALRGPLRGFRRHRGSGQKTNGPRSAACRTASEMNRRLIPRSSLVRG